MARRGAGKQGGFRVLIVFRLKGLAIFVHGFAKSKAANIRLDEVFALKKLALLMLAHGEVEFHQAVEAGTLIEVNCHGSIEAIP